MSRSVLSWIIGVVASVRISAGAGDSAARPLPIGAATTAPRGLRRDADVGVALAEDLCPAGSA
jgi:hypothetical protein